ncbi:unnamed protein product [Brassica napus]|uniref:(rape) hypothetical protein n=1 Tax=Brassica napus TaxID=3708 RepID=A0A816R8F9_BRANA|nr:unnamed protein product [Brassica napus]
MAVLRYPNSQEEEVEASELSSFSSVAVSSNQDHVLPLDAIATGDAPCLKRACLPCGGGEHQTMENINTEALYLSWACQLGCHVGNRSSLALPRRIRTVSLKFQSERASRANQRILLREAHLHRSSTENPNQLLELVELVKIVKLVKLVELVEIVKLVEIVEIVELVGIVEIVCISLDVEYVLTEQSPQPLSDHYLSCPVPEKPLSVAVLPTSKSGSKKALKCPWEYDLKYATHVCVQVVHLTDEYWERVVQYQTYFLSHLSQSQLKQQFPLMTSCHYINNIKLQLLASGNGHHLKHENYPG